MKNPIDIKNQNRRTKAYNLLRDVIIPHHPKYRDSQVREFLLDCAEDFNCEHIVEKLLPRLSKGKFTYVDQAHMDNCDGSDTKVLMLNPKRKRGEISAVQNKAGALRVVVVNPMVDRTDYFYIPKQAVKKLKEQCYGKRIHFERIFVAYNEKKQSYGLLDDYRVESFLCLANKMG